MAVLATDDFNRADGALGANWTQMSTYGTFFEIVSNKAVVTSLASDAGNKYSGITWPNDQYAQCKVFSTGGASGQGPGVLLRGTGLDTLYRIVVFVGGGSNEVELSKFTPGKTQLWVRSSAFVAGDTLRAEIQGSTIRVYRNGVQIGASTTDAGIASGAPGVVYSSTSTTASVDDWEGGDIPYVPTFADTMSAKDHPKLPLRIPQPWEFPA